MHEQILKIIVEDCRKRMAEGDCPITPPHCVEHLEDAVMQLDDRATVLSVALGDCLSVFTDTDSVMTVTEERIGAWRKALQNYGSREPENANDKTGVELIAIERKRQQQVEGWDEAHDDKTQNSEQLALAASVYALPPSIRDVLGAVEKTWPWDLGWFKPGNRLRELAKAGALIAAEIDRIQRIGAK